MFDVEDAYECLLGIAECQTKSLPTAPTFVGPADSPRQARRAFACRLSRAFYTTEIYEY